VHTNEWLSPILLIAAAAASQPLAKLLPLAMPATVVQLLTGLLLGPTLLGELHIDGSVRFLSALGMAYLLFVTGVELQQGWRLLPSRKRAVVGPALSWLSAAPLAFVIASTVHTGNWPTIFVVLSATLVLPTVIGLRDVADSLPGWVRLTVTSAALGDLGAAAATTITALASHTAGAVATLALLIAAVTVSLLAGRTGGRSMREPPVTSPPATSPPATGRKWALLALLAIVLAAAAALPFGAEAVIGATAAAIVLSSSRQADPAWRRARQRVDRIGQRALAPMSFVAAGARIHLAAALGTGQGRELVAALFVAVLIAKLLPTVLVSRRQVGSGPALGAGLLLSTKLTVVVVAVQIALGTGALSQVDASAELLACAITVCVFPTLARALIGRGATSLSTHPAERPSRDQRLAGVGGAMP
jgi:Kef-type K+ transport system membrane component KefB